MMHPFVGGPFQRSTTTATSASLASRHFPRAPLGSQPPSPPEDARLAAPEDGDSPFADLPDPSDPLFAEITNREFETLTTLFHAAYRRARARMPWCGWLTFMDPSALVVDPPGAPHTFPGRHDWRPRPADFLDSLSHSDADPEDDEIAHLRGLFDFIFRTGLRTDLPPCAARLRRVLLSPAATVVLARAGGVPPSRASRLMETGTSSQGIADLLKFAARLLSLARADPAGIPLECATSLHSQYGSDDMDRRLGQMLPTCPAQRHARSALSLLASHFGGYTWHPSPRPSSPTNLLPVQFILDRTFDVVEDCLRWAYHVMLSPASEFPEPSRRQSSDDAFLSEWEALLKALIAIVNVPPLAPAGERPAQLRSREPGP
jgi:hypothetical protein